MKLQVARKFKPLYTQDTRYYFLKGGRGSAKSFHTADRLLMLLLQEPDESLICLREIQRSIKHSSKKLLEDRIEHHGLYYHFEILETEIRSKIGSGVIIFSGLQNHTVDSIKSLENFKYAWTEESQSITSHSLELLIPTIRKDGSKLFFTYNPMRSDDPIADLEMNTDDKTVIFANYTDNPFCPKAIFQEASAMKIRRPKKYRHIYLGETGDLEGVIFENWTARVIMEEEYKGLECVQGLDFGYTNDPTSFCINYIDDTNRKIFVIDGFYKKGLSNAEIASRIILRQAHKHLTRADSAEPKSIDYIKNKGVYMIPAEKGKDSIMQGIDYLKEYDIIVNAHLSDFIEELNNYTWKMDKMTNKPMNEPIDDYNHFLDSLRYSVSHKYRNPLGLATANIPGL